MKKIITTIFIIAGYFANAQTYNPSNFTVSNKSYGVAQAVSTDARSWFYDAGNFVMRDYQSTTEVNTYLNLAKYRSGHFPIFVHSGGTLNGNGTYTGGITQVFWYKDSTGNANLVRWYTDSVATTGVFFAIANNLSEGNPTTIKTNLSLQNVNNTSDATKNAAAVSLTNHTIDGSLNTLINIGNSSLTNSTIGLSLTATGTDVSIPNPAAALGANNTINIPTASASARGVVASSDWSSFHAKVDSTTVSNDSVYDWHNGTKSFRYIVVTGPNNWSLLGNAGTVSATNFLGTTDNVQLNFRVNNQASGKIDHINNNLFYGYNAGSSNIATRNTAIGNYALMVSSGLGNTAVGDSALKNNSSGGSNAAFATNALNANTTGSFNTGIGVASLASLSSGDNNTAIGEASIHLLTTGSRNTVAGANVMNSVVTGNDNAVFGREGLRNQPSASNNVVVGSLALRGSSSGTSNAATGNVALGFAILSTSSTIGINNVLIGREVNNSGVNVGDSNIVIGAYNTTTSTSNTTLIGTGMSTSLSNIVAIGQSSQNVIIGVTAPSTDNGAKLQVSGNKSFGVVVSSAGTLSLSATASTYSFSGTTATWSLPAISGKTGWEYIIKNRGSGILTINVTGATTTIYSTAAVATYGINPGEGFTFVNDGTYWEVF